MPIPIAILEIRAVVVLSGIFKSPITPNPITAVITIGTEPISPAQKFLKKCVELGFANKIKMDVYLQGHGEHNSLNMKIFVKRKRLESMDG